MGDGASLLCSGQAAAAALVLVPRSKGSSPVFMEHLERGKAQPHRERERLSVTGIRAPNRTAIHQTLLMHRIKKN